MLGRNGSTTRQANGLPTMINDEMSFRITFEHTADISDVVQKGSYDRVILILHFDRLKHRSP